MEMDWQKDICVPLIVVFFFWDTLYVYSEEEDLWA